MQKCLTKISKYNSAIYKKKIIHHDQVSELLEGYKAVWIFKSQQAKLHDHINWCKKKKEKEVFDNT